MSETDVQTEADDRPTGPEGLPKGAWRLSADARDTTLGEHGNQLLVGSVPDGFTCAPVDLAYRAMVGRMVDRNQALVGRAGLKFLYYLAYAIERMGGEDFGKLPIGDRVVKVGQTMRMTDAAYLTYCRMSELHDGEMRVHIGRARCKSCMQRLPDTVKVDLRTLQIRTFEEPPKAWYRLLYPWYVGGQLVETLEMEPPFLNHAIEPRSDEEMNDQFLQTCAWIAASIRKINGKKASVRMDDIITRSSESGRTIYDEDFGQLDHIVSNLIQGGMANGIEWHHDPGCGAPVAIPVSWESAFFGRGVA